MPLSSEAVEGLFTIGGPEADGLMNLAAARAATGKGTWICALVKTCKDCLPRHGFTRPMAEWAAMGGPATGWSVCGGACQCMIVPEAVGTGVDPLMRERSTIRGLTVRVPKGLIGGGKEFAAFEDQFARSIEYRRAFRLLGQQNAARRVEIRAERAAAHRQSAQRRALRRQQR